MFVDRDNKDLNSKEFRILEYLKPVEKASENDVILHIWGAESYFIKRSLAVYCAKLRKKGYKVYIINGFIYWENKEKPI